MDVFLVMRVVVVMGMMVMVAFVMVLVMVVVMVAWLLVVLHTNIPDAIQPHVLQETLQTSQRDGSIFSISVEQSLQVLPLTLLSSLQVHHSRQ